MKLELEDPPTREEIKKATMQLKVGKSLAIDGIPAEVYQYGGDAVLGKLQDLFTNCYEKGDCSNYRGTTLFSIAGRILAIVLLNRFIPTIAQGNKPESQYGLRSNGGTTDMIFVLKEIQEKCREQDMGQSAALLDLTKAFDTVSYDGLWTILARLGCPLPSPFQKFHLPPAP